MTKQKISKLIEPIQLESLKTAKKKYRYKAAHKLAEQNAKQNSGFYIKGKINILGLDSMYDFGERDIVFPIDMFALQRKCLDEYLQKCDITMTDVDNMKLALNSLSDINRLCDNIYMLAMRCNTNVHKSVFDALVREPKFIKYLKHPSRGMRPDISKICTALRYPVLDQNNKRLFIRTKQHKIEGIMVYTGIHVYKTKKYGLVSENFLNKLIEQDV